MAVDSAGNVWVATIINGGVTIVSPDGSKVSHVPMPDPLTTNVCFGGLTRRRRSSPCREPASSCRPSGRARG
jgi:gluconolactonase